MTKCIDTTTLAEAYKQCIQHIVWPSNHRIITTEDNEKVWRAKDTIILHVSNPSYDLKTLIDYYPWGPLAMEQYTDEIMGTDHRETKNTTDDFSYTYHDRLTNYQINTVMSINQIDEIVRRLTSSPTSRRAVAITWRPYEDNYLNTHSPPCLQWLKCEIVDGYLNLFTVWRSRDVLLGLGANIYALNKLHQHIAQRCNCKVGFYEDITTDAHIYFLKDANYLKRWLE
jgi:thymidylate synthase